MRIAIVGDYCEDYATHRAMLPALHHAGAEGEWIPTPDAAKAVTYSAIWLAPGSPYASFDNVLTLIRFARERGAPFLGTCGGFQHVLIEFARNVLGIPNADSAEHGTPQATQVIIPVTCPISQDPAFPKLYGPETVHIRPGTTLRRILETETTAENYFCNFEENPEFRARYEAAGLRISAVNGAGIARAVEIPGHAFFLATQFQPQMRSAPGSPHPLLASLASLLMESA